MSLQASKVGHAEAPEKVRAILEKVSLDLSWKVVEDDVAALSQVEIGTP